MICDPLMKPVQHQAIWSDFYFFYFVQEWVPWYVYVHHIHGMHADHGGKDNMLEALHLEL